jgi:hypothetical protein
VRQKDVDQIAETVEKVARYADEHTVEGIRELAIQLARDIEYAARSGLDVSRILEAVHGPKD